MLMEVKTKFLILDRLLVIFAKKSILQWDDIQFFDRIHYFRQSYVLRPMLLFCETVQITLLLQVPYVGILE